MKSKVRSVRDEQLSSTERDENTVTEEDIDADARVTTEMKPVPKDDDKEEPLEPFDEQPEC